MTLCLATSLIEQGCFDALDQMERYFQWANSGYLSSKDHAFGIGKTVFKALLKYRSTKECLEANLVFGHMLWSALSGHDKCDILHLSIHETIRSNGIRSIARGEYQGKAENEISSSGYVVDSLEAALWCFGSTNSLRKKF
jgi:ADP-ribosyl-[dinitrogen reductase] hydrolase